MSKNLPSFVCYPKEGFQSSDITPPRIVNTVRAGPTTRKRPTTGAGPTTEPVRAEPVRETAAPGRAVSTPQSYSNEFFDYFNSLDNRRYRNEIMSEFEYKYINLSLKDQLALKNYIINPFNSNTSDEEKIKILNSLSNPVKDALYLIPRYLGISFDPRTSIDRNNFEIARRNLSIDHGNILNKYMNIAPYERLTMYNNLPAPVKSIADSNFAQIGFKIDDNERNYGQKIYYPSNISMTTGTSIDGVSGGSICVDDMCVNTDNVKDLMKSLITLIKQGGQYYKTNK